jgi:NIPSNAP
MILVRDVFQLKFGKAKEAKELIKEGKKIVASPNFKMGKAMMDLTGRSYTMVLEMEFENLSAFENNLKEVFSMPEWQKWYQKVVPLVESACREIYTIID